MAMELATQEGPGGGAAVVPASPASPVRAAGGAPMAKVRGNKKAAVLLVSIGPERAADVFSRLRDEEIETLSLEMAKLQLLEPGISEGVLAEMVATVEAYDSLSAGGVEYAREVLERALGPERAAVIIGRLSSVIEKRPFEFLRRTPAEQVVTFLRNESPQTIALVIANLHTTLAAAVLSNLPENEQPEIALRIARMSETNPEVVKQVEAVMKEKLASVVHQEVSAAGGVKSLADILNHADRSTERNVLDSITETDESLGAEVRRLLFVFEDIVKLDDRSIQLILREADQKDLALALRGVADDVKERILSNMSERGAQMLVEEMEFSPPQRKRDIEEAQGRVVAIVRRLEEAGAVVLSRTDEDIVF
jgi:flagellar motor switch protein FliG